MWIVDWQDWMDQADQKRDPRRGDAICNLALFASKFLKTNTIGSHHIISLRMVAVRLVMQTCPKTHRQHNSSIMTEWRSWWCCWWWYRWTTGLLNFKHGELLLYHNNNHNYNRKTYRETKRKVAIPRSSWNRFFFSSKVAGVKNNLAKFVQLLVCFFWWLT